MKLDFFTMIGLFLTWIAISKHRFELYNLYDEVENKIRSFYICLSEMISLIEIYEYNKKIYSDADMTKMLNDGIKQSINKGAFLLCVTGNENINNFLSNCDFGILIFQNEKIKNNYGITCNEVSVYEFKETICEIRKEVGKLIDYCYNEKQTYFSGWIKGNIFALLSFFEKTTITTRTIVLDLRNYRNKNYIISSNKIPKLFF